MLKCTIFLGSDKKFHNLYTIIHTINIFTNLKNNCMLVCIAVKLIENKVLSRRCLTRGNNTRRSIEPY